MNKDVKPPRLSALVISLLARYNGQHRMREDLHEEFLDLVETEGARRARRWYFRQAFRSIPVYMLSSLLWSCLMFKNYLKITLRNLAKQKAISVINISGLAIGMACCLCISLWVLDELSFDRFHENADRLYLATVTRTYSTGEEISCRTCPPLGPTLQAEYSDIALTARHRDLPTMLVRYREKVFYEPDITTVDPSFFRMFSFPFVRGDKDSALNQPSAVVISTDIARKYFGEDDPLGKTLIFNNTDNYVVTGVFQNVPSNSHITFDIALPWSYMHGSPFYDENYWDTGYLETYVLLNPAADPAAVQGKIRDLYQRHIDDTRATLALYPVVDIHLYSNFFRSSVGSIDYVIIFSSLAQFVFLIACINFMNLSTARSANRAKEIGLRKVAGARRGQIIRQFIGESILMAGLALVAAVLLLAAFLPEFNDLSGKEISLLGSINTGILLTGFVLSAVVTGLVAGSYPALYLSSFQPSETLRGVFHRGKAGVTFRKLLVVVQFTLSILLIIFSMVVFSQLNHMLSMDLGWDKDHLLYVNMRSGPHENYSVLKSRLLRDARIRGVSATQSLPTYFGNSSGNVQWEGKDPDLNLSVNFSSVDYDFVKTMDIQLDEGRSFSREFASDVVNGVLINREFKRRMGFTTAAGREVSFCGEPRRIVGVTQDFHTHSAREAMEPAIMLLSDKNLHYMVVRIDGASTAAALAFLEQTWREVIPDYPLVYTFFDDRIAEAYRREACMSHLLGYAAVLAAFIACLGLFGLSSFTAEKRTREIGIRKVFGASSEKIVALLSSDFLKLVVLANLIAWPVAFWAVNTWLEQFSYRADIGVPVYLLAGATALLVALLAVSVQSVKVARANPANSLRHE
ncbi:MAG: ABC transporter permease [Acidobacteria bacterium]|nr:ABC transporter permease [Acidobacteriota bacterium]